MVGLDVPALEMLLRKVYLCQLSMFMFPSFIDHRPMQTSLIHACRLSAQLLFLMWTTYIHTYILTYLQAYVLHPNIQHAMYNL